MSTINQRNWKTFFDIRRELNLDKIPEPDLEEKVVKHGGWHKSNMVKTDRYTDRHVEGPRQGEMPLGKWVRKKAEQLGLSADTIWARIYDGNLKVPNKRVVNSRVIFVKI